MMTKRTENLIVRQLGHLFGYSGGISLSFGIGMINGGRDKAMGGILVMAGVLFGAGGILFSIVRLVLDIRDVPRINIDVATLKYEASTFMEGKWDWRFVFRAFVEPPTKRTLFLYSDCLKAQITGSFKETSWSLDMSELRMSPANKDLIVDYDDADSEVEITRPTILWFQGVVTTPPKLDGTGLAGPPDIWKATCAIEDHRDKWSKSETVALSKNGNATWSGLGSRRLSVDSVPLHRWVPFIAIVIAIITATVYVVWYEVTR